MIYIDNNKKIPLYEQIYNGFCRMILDGELEKGSRLKPIRNMAKELNVSNNTVSRAYQQLIEDGYVRSVPGSGFYVRKILYAQKKKAEFSKNSREQESVKCLYDFSYEMVEATNFPWSKWRRYLDQAISDEANSSSIGYEEKKGSFSLRKVLCDYVQETRGIRCTPEQVIICAGKQYAMDIIFDVLPKEYQMAGVENPSLKRVRKSFLDNGKTVAPITVKKTGLDVNALEKSKCNMLYITPSHNFPTGYVTPLTKRVQILEWAKRTNSYVIEDDFENEFFEGMQTIPAIQSMDRNGRVIYMHTLSRVLSPSIRCTYIILPAELLEAYEKRYQYYYTALPIHNQKALAGFIEDGHLERQARKTCAYNKKKCLKMQEEMQKRIPHEVKCHTVSSNNHILMEIPGCGDASVFCKKMERYGIRIYAAEEFWMEQKEKAANTFLLGIHGIEDDEIEDACELLSDALQQCLGENIEEILEKRKDEEK